MHSVPLANLLHQVPPELLLREIASVLLVGLDSLEDVASRAELHHKTEGLRRIIEKGLFVLYDIFMPET